MTQWHLILAKAHALHIGPMDAAKGLAGLVALVLTVVPWGRRGVRQRHWDSPKFIWGLDREFAKWISKRKPGTFLGKANGHAAVITDVARESHMQIVGPTRSGKSQLLLSIAAQDMAKGMPIFLMEAKGDRSDFDQFLKAAQLSNRVRDVRYFNPQDPRSMTFNPIRRVPEQTALVVSQQIARVIGREPTSTGQGKDYYSQLDFNKVQDMAEIFCKTGREFTLRDCFYYYVSASAREKAFKLCGDEGLKAMARRSFEDAKDTSGITPLIRPYITGRLGDLLNSYTPQIKLDEVFSKGQLAYFAIPVAHLQVLANPLGRMLITGLINLSSWRQIAVPKEPPASITLDEFAEFATPSFKSLIQSVGSARLWTILSHQDRTQLNAVVGTEQTSFASSVFTNSSGCKVSFRTPSPDDAEFWSRTIGTYRVFEDTERVVKGFLGDRRTGDASRKSVEEFKIHPNQLKNLKSGTALVFCPAEQECIAKTARIYSLLPKELPELPEVEVEPAEGLDLESAATETAVAKSLEQEFIKA